MDKAKKVVVRFSVLSAVILLNFAVGKGRFDGIKLVLLLCFLLLLTLCVFLIFLLCVFFHAAGHFLEAQNAL